MSWRKRKFIQSVLPDLQTITVCLSISSPAQIFISLFSLSRWVLLGYLKFLERVYLPQCGVNFLCFAYKMIHTSPRQSDGLSTHEIFRNRMDLNQKEKLIITVNVLLRNLSCQLHVLERGALNCGCKLLSKCSRRFVFTECLFESFSKKRKLFVHVSDKFVVSGLVWTTKLNLSDLVFIVREENDKQWQQNEDIQR